MFVLNRWAPLVTATSCPLQAEDMRHLIFQGYEANFD